MNIKEENCREVEIKRTAIVIKNRILRELPDAKAIKRMISKNIKGGDLFDQILSLCQSVQKSKDDVGLIASILHTKADGDTASKALAYLLKNKSFEVERIAVKNEEFLRNIKFKKLKKIAVKKGLIEKKSGGLLNFIIALITFLPSVLGLFTDNLSMVNAIPIWVFYLTICFSLILGGYGIYQKLNETKSSNRNFYAIICKKLYDYKEDELITFWKSFTVFDFKFYDKNIIYIVDKMHNLGSLIRSALEYYLYNIDYKQIWILFEEYSDGFINIGSKQQKSIFFINKLSLTEKKMYAQKYDNTKINNPQLRKYGIDYILWDWATEKTNATMESSCYDNLADRISNYISMTSVSYNNCNIRTYIYFIAYFAYTFGLDRSKILNEILSDIDGIRKNKKSMPSFEKIHNKLFDELFLSKPKGLENLIGDIIETFNYDFCDIVNGISQNERLKIGIHVSLFHKFAFMTVIKYYEKVKSDWLFDMCWENYTNLVYDNSENTDKDERSIVIIKYLEFLEKQQNYNYHPRLIDQIIMYCNENESILDQFIKSDIVKKAVLHNLMFIPDENYDSWKQHRIFTQLSVRDKANENTSALPGFFDIYSASDESKYEYYNNLITASSSQAITYFEALYKIFCSSIYIIRIGFEYFYNPNFIDNTIDIENDTILDKIKEICELCNKSLISKGQMNELLDNIIIMVDEINTTHEYSEDIKMGILMLCIETELYGTQFTDFICYFLFIKVFGSNEVPDDTLFTDLKSMTVRTPLYSIPTLSLIAQFNYKIDTHFRDNLDSYIYLLLNNLFNEQLVISLLSCLVKYSMPDIYSKIIIGYLINNKRTTIECIMNAANSDRIDDIKTAAYFVEDTYVILYKLTKMDGENRKDIERIIGDINNVIIDKTHDSNITSILNEFYHVVILNECSLLEDVEKAISQWNNQHNNLTYLIIESYLDFYDEMNNYTLLERLPDYLDIIMMAPVASSFICIYNYLISDKFKRDFDGQNRALILMAEKIMCGLTIKSYCDKALIIIHLYYELIMCPAQLEVLLLERISELLLIESKAMDSKKIFDNMGIIAYSISLTKTLIFNNTNNIQDPEYPVAANSNGKKEKKDKKDDRSKSQSSREMEYILQRFDRINAIIDKAGVKVINLGYYNMILFIHNDREDIQEKLKKQYGEEFIRRHLALNVKQELEVFRSYVKRLKNTERTTAFIDRAILVISNHEYITEVNG